MYFGTTFFLSAGGFSVKEKEKNHEVVDQGCSPGKPHAAGKGVTLSSQTPT